jgi:hypothetical protein
MKHLKSILFVAALVACGLSFVVVESGVIKALGLIGFVGGILWWYKTAQQD